MKVQFPGLWGIDFELRKWAFEVFNIQIFWYGLIIAFGFLLAVVLAIRSSRKYGIEPDNILDLVLFATPAAIVFARLYYVVFSWDQFRDNPIDIVLTRNGGLAIYGGVIGAVLVAWIYARKKKIPAFGLMDFAVPYLVLGQGIGRWGNFVNQEAFGTMTSLPWRMNGTIINEYLTGVQPGIDLSKWGVHPTFLYESLFDFAVFAFLIFYRKKKKYDGEVISLYFILYGIGRFFIEGLRTDSLMLGSIRVSQLLSALLVIVFTTVFIIRRRKRIDKLEEEAVIIGQSKYGSLLMKMKEEEASKENAEAAGAEAEEAEEAEESIDVMDAKEVAQEESEADAKGEAEEET